MRLTRPWLLHWLAPRYLDQQAESVDVQAVMEVGDLQRIAYPPPKLYATVTMDTAAVVGQRSFHEITALGRPLAIRSMIVRDLETVSEGGFWTVNQAGVTQAQTSGTATGAPVPTTWGTGNTTGQPISKAWARGFTTVEGTHVGAFGLAPDGAFYVRVSGTGSGAVPNPNHLPGDGIILQPGEFFTFQTETDQERLRVSYYLEEWPPMGDTSAGNVGGGWPYPQEG